MSRRDARHLLIVVALAGAFAGTGQAGAAPLPRFGQPLTPTDLKGEFAIPPSGAGLPPGSGSSQQGKAVFSASCAACHGGRLQGNKALGAPALVGGRGTLAAATPLKTVESYWPYATTLFDYVKRAMPFNAPGSLSDGQTYAVVAYILAEGHIIKADDVMDAKTLPKVRMPNANGFIRDPRPKL